MLRIDCINVGDGDAILIRLETEGVTRTVLVDCGRPLVEFVQGSKRTSCIDYLMREGIERIDLLVVSHLHLDHFGGALAVLRHIPVRRMIALCLPPSDARWIIWPQREVKTVVGLCDALNLWNDTVKQAKALGTECAEATAEELALGDLRLRFYLPDPALRARQKALFYRLYSGELPTETELRLISRERNCSSILLLAGYANRRILLAGDSYADYWQGMELPPCDILKLPHHGDGKSMNEVLLRALQPEFAVISCQNDPTQKKDRPNARVLELLLRTVPRVLCTENRAFPFYPAATHDAVRFGIDKAGSISCPVPPGEGP
ncbi:MAG: MBL fold metallo-hydrolase [Clostridiales bacterium]|nr:MBL fold metallo-hydrolase [Clostridiales bacterium]